VYFSTHQIDCGSLTEAWEKAVAEHCGPFAMETGSQFEGVIDARIVGQFTCARVAHNSGEAIRTEVELAASQTTDYFVLLQLCGRCRMEQGDASTQMLPGDIAIIDSARPSRLEFNHNNALHKNIQLCLHIPKATVAAAGDDWSGKLATALPRSTSRLVSALLTSAFEQMAPTNAASSQAISTAILELISAGWAKADDLGSAVEAVSPSKRLKLIQDHVVGALSDDSLSVAKIGRTLGISERKIHRTFEEHGLSIGSWIRQMRLDRCARDLRDPCLSRQTITEVAFRWGFNSAAHFSRIFHEAFGQTPSSYRKDYRAAPKAVSKLAEPPGTASAA